MSERKITVTKTAILNWQDRLLDHRSHQEIEKDIHDCVEAGLRDGIIFDHRPTGFVLYRRKSDKMPPGQRFVQCDRDSRIGFVIKRTPSEGDIVVTTLTKAGVR